MMAPYGAWVRCSKWLVLVVALMAAAAGQARTVRVLVLGDSLAAGYGLAAADGFQAQMAAALRARGHDVALVDGAVSGDTTAGGRARLDWALGDQTGGDGVDAVVVELGANDGLRGLPTAEMERNLAAVLDALAARRLPVLLTGMEAPPNMGADYARAFHAVFQRLGARPGLVFDPFFLEGVAGNPALNQPDHIHPNPAGVRVEVARLVPVMERLLGEVR